MKYMQKMGLILDAMCNFQHSCAVEAEFSSLEAKVAQFVALCERLRTENADLRRQLADAQSDARRLNEKIDGAKNRLEGLINRLPG
jgi:cell division protein ZapB